MKTNSNRKRSFTLLELLISLSLSAIIITLLLTFTFKLFLTERKIKITKQEFLTDTALEIKLRSLFSELVLDSAQNKTTPKNNNPNDNTTQRFGFHTTKKEAHLFFIFNAHANLNPFFSGKLKGELFLDEHKNLILTTYSLTEELPPKTEILAPNIQSLEFTFFTRKEAQYPGDTTYASAFFWERPEPPAAMQITIQKTQSLEPPPLHKKPPLKLTFFLDNMQSSIICFEDK